MTSGEQRVMEALGPKRTSDSDTFLWWYEPVLRDFKSGHDRTPDFVVLDRFFGLLVLEVKDWAIDQIMSADMQSWKIRKGGSTRSETAPAEQARVASHTLRSLLETNARMVQSGGAHSGKTMIPIGYGGILPNITRAEATVRGLPELLQGQYYFFHDDLSEGAGLGGAPLAIALRRQVKPRFPVPALDTSLLEVLASLISPHVAVSVIPDLRSEAEVLQIQRLDAEQETYARDLGDGHRILTGCAGSGKTLVVAARARFLKQAHPLWRIRVICFNAELVPYIYAMLGDMQNDKEPKICVQNFHAYARECLGSTLQRNEGDDEASFAERTVTAFIRFANSPPAEGAYDALLIDEGQDLRPEWTNALVRLVNRATNSVLFSASRQQNIYGISSYKDLGIEATGRTKHLRKSYRCSTEIITLAEAFQPEVLRQGKRGETTQNPLGLFELSQRGSRRVPQFVACGNVASLTDYICREIQRSIQAGLCSFKDVAILYTDRFQPSLEPIATKLCNQFGPQSVFCKWKAGGRLLPSDDTIKMTTIHGSKGLEWRIVFLLGMDRIPRANFDLTKERSLAYVALTRAQDEVHFVSLQEQGFHRDLKQLDLTVRQ